ncbi:hypothetical protein E4U34_008395, partial [Claviceps purpurea]
LQRWSDELDELGSQTPTQAFINELQYGKRRLRPRSAISWINHHGGVASRTADNGPAIAAAWAACRDGGEVYIPAGEYGLDTWVVLNKGQHVSLNIEGTIFRTG